MGSDAVAKRLHRSFANFFRGRKENQRIGFPRFKSADAWNTIQFRDAASCMDGNYLKMPKLCGGRLREIGGDGDPRTIRGEIIEQRGIGTAGEEQQAGEAESDQVGEGAGGGGRPARKQQTRADEPSAFRGMGVEFHGTKRAAKDRY